MAIEQKVFFVNDFNAVTVVPRMWEINGAEVSSEEGLVGKP
jgi:hypothetical protein